MKDVKKKKENRKDLIKKYVGADNNPLLTELIDDIIETEDRLKKVRACSFIKDDKETDASVVHSRLLASYIASIKAISFISGKNKAEEDESYLEQYFRSKVK